MTLTAEQQRRAYARMLGAAAQPQFWIFGADLCSVLAAVFLPWSTSAVSIFLGLWFLFFVPTMDLQDLSQKFRTTACFLPLSFFALAVLGMFWADSSWSVRVHGLHPLMKFLALPYLLLHFSRSQRAHWVFIGFIASCALLTLVSWFAFFAGWNLRTAFPGVPVKNYIDQSQELTLCIFAAAPYLLSLLTQRHWKRAILLSALMLAMFFNMMFVAVARTAIVYIPILAAVFAARYLSYRWTIGLFLAGVIGAVVLWFASPYLRERYELSVRDYKLSQSTDIATSNGERLAYWRTSIHAISQAPLLGKGTGATEALFKEAAKGKSGEWANAVRSPHNQTLYVAIQWGLFGSIILYAMWYFHLSLFLERDLVSWIGLLVVVQNFISSLLNAHLFDFQEGWVYVIGVATAGGIKLSGRLSLSCLGGGDGRCG